MIESEFEYIYNSHSNMIYKIDYVAKLTDSSSKQLEVDYVLSYNAKSPIDGKWTPGFTVALFNLEEQENGMDSKDILYPHPNNIKLSKLEVLSCQILKEAEVYKKN